MATLPLLKLSGLLVKTIAKPVATRLKIESVKHPKFQKMCIGMGQLAHQIASRVNVLASGYRFIGVKPLEEDAALSKGINFFSESFVFLVAGTIIVVEYNNSEQKSALNKEKAAIEKAQERLRIDEQFASLEARLNDIEKILPKETVELIRYREGLRRAGRSEEEIDLACAMKDDGKLIAMNSETQRRLQRQQEEEINRQRGGGGEGKASVWYWLWKNLKIVYP